MVRKFGLLLVIFPLILMSCGVQESTPVRLKKVPTISASVTVVTAVAVMETATPANPCAGVSCATPTQAPTPSPTLESSQSGTPQAAGQAAAFQDCASTPGLLKCDPQAGPLGGEVAFIDDSAKRLVALDLRTGAGWQAALPVLGGAFNARLPEWSPKGDKLLVSVGPDDYQVFDQAGKQVDAFTNSVVVVHWRPDGTLAQDGSVVGPQGQVARVDLTGDTGAVLHVTMKPGEKEKVVPLSAPPGEEFQLDAWFPDRNKLLAQAYFPSNSATLIGGGLVTIDPISGTVHPWGMSAPLADRGIFAWNPKTPTLMAFRMSGVTPEMMTRLIGLEDFSTGKLSTILPRFVSAGDLTWAPDGKRLVFSVNAILDEAPESVKKTFPGPGVYEFDPQSGKVALLFATPRGAFDGFLNFTADGQTLIYARAVGPDERTAIWSYMVELHARAFSQPPATNVPDRVLVKGLTVHQSTADDRFWEYFIAFRQVAP